MKFCGDKVFQKFLDELCEYLKRDNDNKRLYQEKTIDIPFVISALWQDFKDNQDKYSNFLKELNESEYYNFYIDDKKYYYNIRIGINIVNKENQNSSNNDWRYELDFSTVSRYWGYCECTPNDPDYREDKGCCGHGCDWDAPKIELRKSFLISRHSWDGDEHDYWDFEDKFYADDKEENHKKLLAERECKIRNLKETIENAQKKLKELENL